MTIVKPFALTILATSILSFSYGCATLPNVSELINGADTRQKHRQIVSFKGVLSPQKSKAIMERLKRSVNPSDILERHTAVIESVTTSPLTKGNKVILLADGQAAYAAMFKVIQNAQWQINLESYIIEDDETGRKFADLLLKKRVQGVQVNVIYDSFGSMKTPVSFFQRLQEGGINVVEFNPINPFNSRETWELQHRDHRKMLIIDGAVAIIGGINISKVYSSNPLKRKQSKKTPIHWRDTDIQIEGPAVAELEKLFFETWRGQSGPDLSVQNPLPVKQDAGNALVRVVGSTPGDTNRIPFIEYVSAITFAEYSIHMTNSYFIPDKQIIKALTDAAERGVDVKIILPGVTDSQLALHAQRYYYSKLLKSGVNIYEHSTSLLHAKTAVVDKVWSTVGSTNMDFLSLLTNDEVNAVVLNREFAVEMENMFARDLADSKQIQWAEWKNRPYLSRAREWLLNLFIRWL